MCFDLFHPEYLQKVDKRDRLGPVGYGSRVTTRLTAQEGHKLLTSQGHCLQFGAYLEGKMDSQRVLLQSKPRQAVGA